MRTNNCIHRCAAGALALGLLSTAVTASAQNTVVVAGENEHGSRGPSAYLFSSGLVTTGLSYTPALIVAINSDRSEDKYLYAPFVGPWMDLGARDVTYQDDTVGPGRNGDLRGQRSDVEINDVAVGGVRIAHDGLERSIRQRTDIVAGLVVRIDERALGADLDDLVA